MSISPYLSLIVPAYNEAARIEQTIHSMRSYFERRGISFEIIVCADGEDGTREIVARLLASDSRIILLGKRTRAGKGLAVRQGVSRAAGRIIGFADADDKVPIAEIEKILPWFRRGYGIVIGSRGLSDSRIDVRQPWHRRAGSRAFSMIMHALVGLRDICDTQCGFKFFLQPIAKELFAQQRVDGYMFDVEILHLADRWGCRIKEVGIRWRDDGDTRLRLLAGNWQNMLDILRIRLGRHDRFDGSLTDGQTLSEARKAA